MTGRTAYDVVVVDHHDSYTWNLVHLVAAVTGRLPVVVRHDDVAVTDVLAHSHVVLGPGPGHPGVPGDFAVGRDVLAAGRVPVLGVCLGLQAIVVACGGTVEPVAPAHGRVTRITHDGRGLFRGVPGGFAAVRYHSLAATAVPGCLEVSAVSEDGVVMGVRHRALPFEGVQFHPESILSEYGARLIENFLAA